jgi:hypothetical protein
MTVKLNQFGYNYARGLIERGKVVADDRDAWSEHQPTAEQENEFIEANGHEAFGQWHLGIETDAGEDTKTRFKFPYGDFRNLHRCATLAAESRAATVQARGHSPRGGSSARDAGEVGGSNSVGRRRGRKRCVATACGHDWSQPGSGRES